ncbi:N-glycosylase/DNA lyase [Ascodesmis nigricans]|uniref:N-glycosylase/DNA lyase n=1 Tax=Ascodesmis nigricans TaxID=341454 RepID=A0A4V3SIX7_9PEZI|nr:N-glycosylase/DNA lyase [Ascodesmis nigricans]
MTIAAPLWSTLPVPPTELCLDKVLRCGQSFRWKLSAPNEWTCTLRGRVVTLQQEPSHIKYRAVFPPGRSDSTTPTNDDTEELLRDYFNLSVNLEALYSHWSSVDPNFLKKSTTFAGIRILRQDPWENVVSFICSSNNNISRISQMVNNLCLHFGPHLATIDSIDYHDFPEPSALAVPGVEQRLRELGFGYRAKYIAKAALLVANERVPGWLNSLRKVSYREAHDTLLELPGVGPKVADCVCLMSLDKPGALPVDTHVWQIAQRDYKFKGVKGKTLNKTTYDAIGDHFRKLWGEEAGWAHSVLFTADLKAFSEVKNETTVVSTKAVLTAQVETLMQNTSIKQEQSMMTAETSRKRVKREDVEEKEGEKEINDGVAETSSLVDRIKRRRRSGRS